MSRFSLSRGLLQSIYDHMNKPEKDSLEGRFVSISIEVTKSIVDWHDPPLADILCFGLLCIFVSFIVSFMV